MADTPAKLVLFTSGEGWERVHAFGWSSGPLLGAIWNHTEVVFTLLKVSQIFRVLCGIKCILALCTSHARLRHFASKLNVSKTSRLSQMCESKIPLTWSTCHANMSVCAVMLLPGSSCHCVTLEVNGCKTPWTNHHGAIRCVQFMDSS